jgi:hypothetical protein
MRVYQKATRFFGPAGVLFAFALFFTSACERPADTPDGELRAEAAGDTSAGGAQDQTDVAPAVAPGSARGLINAPKFIRGIYLNAYAAGSSNRLEQLLTLADKTEINTFVVDVKDERGVHYETSIELAKQLAQEGQVTLGKLDEFVKKLHDRGIYAIARVVVFKDPILSKAKPEWSIKNPSGGLWVDKAGNTWVSSWDPDVWEYNIQLAEEAARAGFDAVQFDYVRFPEAYKSLPVQTHTKAKGDRTDAIVAFLRAARPRVHAAGAALQADVFGLSPNDPSDVNIGQQWEAIISNVDHVLPMVYPSHYFPTHLRGIKTPNKMPFETVFASVGIGVLRRDQLMQAGVKETARIIPWLQAFNAPWVNKDFPYGPEQAAAQTKAVYATGLNDWVFWHPGSKYEQVAAAFAPEATDHAGKLEPTADMRTMAELLERQGLKQAREKAVQGAGGATPAPAAAPSTGGPTR